jgi:putative FmdB family regulatory protein
MPIYEYRCNHCGTISEFLVGVSSKGQNLNCKQCGSPQLEGLSWMQNLSSIVNSKIV